MVPRSTPDSRIHTSSVEPDSASGSPEEKPSSKTISTRRCRYTASPSRQEARGAARILGAVDAVSGEADDTVIAANDTVIARLDPPASSSAKADDPVFREACVQQSTPRITGCPAFAGHDGGKLKRRLCP